MGKQEKVITLEDRIPKLKEQRKQKANRRMILYISVFFFLVLVIVYFISPLSHVGKITVSGNRFVDEKTIIEAGGLSGQPGFWDTDASTVAKKIKQIKQIKTAEVDKSFPNQFSINVTEYHRVAYLKEDRHYYPILGNGSRLSALDKGDVPSGAPILVHWPKGKKLSAMAEQLQKLSMPLVHRISEIYYTPTDHFPGGITVYMNDGFEVRALIDDFSKNMEQYPKIISQIDSGAKGIIHMRVGTYFVKYANEGDSGSESK
ncbi:MAG TPA: FtsQ-type POTRA domain-containing protein [Bacillales bacterium]|nr:FtsQ-type POTRA domain-containing protein [Bacillales bacterium]